MTLNRTHRPSTGRESQCGARDKRAAAARQPVREPGVEAHTDPNTLKPSWPRQDGSRGKSPREGSDELAPANTGDSRAKPTPRPVENGGNGM